MLDGCLTNSSRRSLVSTDQHGAEKLTICRSWCRVRCSHCGDLQPKRVATPSRMGGTPGLLFDMSRSCWDLDVQANAERLCQYLRTERPVLLGGSPKCKAFMDLQSMNRRDPKFSKTLEAGLSHLKALIKICRWQSGQGRWFLHEDPHQSWESEY